MSRPYQSPGNLSQEQLDQISALLRSGQLYQSDLTRILSGRPPRRSDALGEIFRRWNALDDTRRSNAKRYARVAGKFLKVAGLAALGSATAVLPGGQAAAGQAFGGIIQELAQMVDDPPWRE